MKRCDIIIPIYNAYGCLSPCIDTVLKNTNFSYAHLFLIDDKSPDERILPLLESYEKKYPEKITLLKNTKNLGFVRTVNKGMKQTKNDVLLLNSDTEVPKNWLEEIISCAYSDPSIATVTPLSNNATLASVPKIFERNDLPEGYDLEKTADLIAKKSLNLYPSIPTAHGFCMFIKRTVIEKVGLFDEEHFGKGYGEENDFSFRCFKYGYRHALCDRTLVLHKESKSFLGEKRDNGAILGKIHPKLKANLDFWIAHPDIKIIGQNISLAIGSDEVRPNILVIIHDWSNISENVGGTTLHVLDIINSLRSNYNFHVLSHESGTYRVHSYFKTTDLVTAIYPEPANISAANFYSSIYEKMLNEIIEDYGISLVHVHHLIGHYFNIKNCCKKHNIKYLVSLHDLYLDFPEVSKLDERISAPNHNTEIDLSSWRQACEGLLASAEKVIAPSIFAKRTYNKAYPKQKISVIEHGVDLEKTTPKRLSGKKKNIAFIGAIFPHKGSEILERLANTNKMKDTRLHLFGMTTAKIPTSDRIINHGRYSRKELPQLLSKNNIDLVCIFSLAPETFAYTVNEAVACGVPVLSFDIGAGAERIKNNNLGRVISYTEDINLISDSITGFLNDSDGYKRVLVSIEGYQIRNVAEMTSDYNNIYRTIAKPIAINFSKIQQRLSFVELYLSSLSGTTNDIYKNAYESLTGSFRWRLVSRFRIPKSISAQLRKLYRRIKQ